MTKKNPEYVVDFLSDGCDYDYDRTDCSGRCDSYCRCTKIVNARVTGVGNSLSMVRVTNKNDSKLWTRNDKVELSEIIQYGIDRLFRIHQLYDVSKWKVNVTGGYYGEEVNGVTLIDHVKEHLFLEDIRKILGIPDIDVVKYVLEKEYAYIHESIAGVTKCEIVELESADLMRQEEHFSRVKHSDMSSYVMVKGLPIGIVYRGIRLIDGYHRLSLAGPGKHRFINLI